MASKEYDNDPSYNTAMGAKVFFRRVKLCPLRDYNIKDINYKNIRLLKGFLSEGGKILHRRITNVSPKKQRVLKLAIKRARAMGLLSYVSN